MLLMLNTCGNTSQLYVEYNARTGKHCKDRSMMEILKVVPFLALCISSFPGEVHTVRITSISPCQNRTGSALSIIISFFKIY